MKLQARIGMGTLQDAFGHWKEKTVWQARQERARQNTQEIQKQATMQEQINGQLAGQL